MKVTINKREDRRIPVCKCSVGSGYKYEEDYFIFLDEQSEVGEYMLMRIDGVIGYFEGSELMLPVETEIIINE